MSTGSGTRKALLVSRWQSAVVVVVVVVMAVKVAVAVLLKVVLSHWQR